MYAPVFHILPVTTLRRERLLPVPGRITVHIDQKVSTLDVVAEAHYGQNHMMIDVARMLGLSAEAAMRLIQVKAGHFITKGQVIVQRFGISPLTLRAPSNGRVILVGSGRILMEVGDESFELRAGLPGRVTRFIPERGVEITFNGALVQGVWGNGLLGLGLMLPVFDAADETLPAGRIDISLRGSILLAGHCADGAVLKAAADLPVRGMILASLAPALVPLAEEMKYPIVVIDGFGKRAMDAVSFKLLTTNARREVTLNAEPPDLQAGSKPEILIPLPVTQDPAIPREVETFAPGQMVRLTRAPQAGEIGSLVKLLPGMVPLPSGLRVAAAEVRLDSGDLVTTPLANLEVLG
jgi:hypothetical protein